VVLAIVADSHIGNDDNEYIENKTLLARALEKVKSSGADEFIHVGDITNYEETEALSDAKEIMDNAGLPYYALPGDRDIAGTSSPATFVSVFGTENQYFELGGYKFVLFDNAANFTPISKDKMDWFKVEVSDADFVILSQPLYVEGIVNCQYMGSTCETVEDADLKSKQEKVLAQRNELLKAIRDSDVKAVIAGDHHVSSETQDDVRPNLMHYVVGAVGNTFKEGYSQTAWQTQRFSLMKLYDKGAFTVEDVSL
jgi:3',5'-cyclic AMP phosphodiesterase CpdA